jgi:hypothetical protein
MKSNLLSQIAGIFSGICLMSAAIDSPFWAITNAIVSGSVGLIFLL